MVEEAVCKNSKKDWRGAAMVKREREMCHLSGGWNGWSVSSRMRGISAVISRVRDLMVMSDVASGRERI